ncbi:SPFH domain-containing protein [Prevotella jejuni]|mgnify:FL=1|jgi:SPFH/band 7/PHB domain protein|uniref:SPFH domain-containing protein n=1 Tax=Prevotella jejuni TaxID=1177574 RepID=UPI001C5EF115|nr:SPFH domain-containing protein [Prevotella jejuni]MBW4772049.1 SPFH domain-containing protein [Prevotella jejuni]
MNPNQRQNNQQRLNSNLSNFFNMNNAKKLLIPVALIATACALSLVFFTFVNPSYDQEAALKMKPIFFGSTRVSDEPVNSITLVAPTTSAVYFNILPQKMQFQFDDLLSNDNTPLDVNMYMIIQVKKGQTPDLLRNYGENWFENFIEPYFRNKVREYVSSCSPFDLMSNREVLAKFDDRIKQSMRQYVASLSRKANFPVDIQQVITDRVMPNKEQLEEMNKTAASIQAKQTQEKRAEMELARAKAERNKAVADKAYMTELNLSPAQFIQLRAWDVIEKKNGANIDVLFGGGETPMWNIRR